MYELNISLNFNFVKIKWGRGEGLVVKYRKGRDKDFSINLHTFPPPNINKNFMNILVKKVSILLVKYLVGAMV